MDILAEDMTVLVASIALTRTDDSRFTATHAAIAGAAWMIVSGTRYYFNDDGSKGNFVFMEWAFDIRSASLPTPPTFYADMPGCTGITITQSGIPFVPCCPAMVGIVPFNAGVPTVESFKNQQLYAMPGALVFDDMFGAHWQAAVETTMPDPFYQEPFKPDCSIFTSWAEDDGTGNIDSDDGQTKYYPYRRLVEALAIYPGTGGLSGYGPSSTEVPPTLPAGVSLYFDTSVNTIAPPFFPSGIPIGDSAGNYSSVWRPWGFYLNACANIKGGGNFAGVYAEYLAC